MAINYRAIADRVVDAIRARGDDIAATRSGITVRQSGVWSKPFVRGEQFLKVEIERAYRDARIYSKVRDINEVVALFRRDPDLWRDDQP